MVPGTSIRCLTKGLPILVAAIRDTGLDAVHEEDLYFRHGLRDLLTGLGVTDVDRNHSGRNRVQFVLGGDDGMVDSAGETVPDMAPSCSRPSG